MKFIHTADWQLGKPFSRIADPDKAAKLRNERIEAIRRMRDLVSANKAEFVLVAGDLFDSTTTEKSVVSAACSAIGEIGVPVYAIPGNHDHGGPGGLWGQEFFLQECKSLAPNFEILLAKSPLERDDFTLLPCPLLRQHESQDPTHWLRNFDFAALDSSKPRIVLAHGSVHGFDSSTGGEEAGGTANLLQLDRIPLSEIDYIALGDWHGTKQVNDKTWYSGTPEIDRFPRGEQNQPGNLLLVESAREQSPVVEILPSGRIGWHNFEFTLASDSDVDQLKEEIAKILGNRAGEDLLRLTLRGSLSLSAASRIEEEMVTLESRLLHLRKKFETVLAPSEEEVESLADRPTDPLISEVAKGLIDSARGSGEEAEVARIALRELYSAVST